MNNPKISIIIPVYKVEKYLRQCLDSVINQTLKDIEIIIVDEGDLDECRKIIDEYKAKDSRIKTIHEKNGGYGASVNKGFDLATGEYLGIVESDDFIEPEMYEKMYVYAKNFDVDVVKSNAHFYYEKEPILCYFREIVPSNLYNKVFSPKEYQEIFISMASVWSAIYNRNFINKNKIRFTENPKASFVDISFTFKVFACAENVYLIKDAFVHYRQDNENASIKNDGKVFCVCDEYKEIENFLNENPDKQACFGQIKNKIKFIHYLWNFRRIANKYKKSFIKYISKEFKKTLQEKEVDKNLFSKQEWQDYNLIAKHPMIFLVKYCWS